MTRNANIIFEVYVRAYEDWGDQAFVMEKERLVRVTLSSDPRTRVCTMKVQGKGPDTWEKTLKDFCDAVTEFRGLCSVEALSVEHLKLYGGYILKLED